MAVEPITRFLLAVGAILLVSHFCGEVLRRAGQPPVLGEIVGGLLLGPSVLGLIWPSGGAWLFAPEVLSNLDRAAQLGLVVFMFLLGCELRTDRIERKSLVGAVVLGGMGLPFAAGIGVAFAASSVLAGAGAPKAGFVLFFALALAITAMPVLARILVDLKIERTGLGALSLTSAAIGDGIAWLTLTLILVGTGVHGSGNVVTTAILAVALVVGTQLVVRRVLSRLVTRIESEKVMTVLLLVGAIGFAVLTQMLGLHALLGAFLFGTAVPRDCPLVERISEQLRGFTVVVLLPLFFALVGLSTSIGLLGTDVSHWLLFAGVLVVAQLTKFLGAGGAARLAGLPGRQAIQLGTLMNCRGVTELVVATIGLKYGLVNQLGFTILVLVAVVTTAITGPLMRFLIRREISEVIGNQEDVPPRERLSRSVSE
ncbi:cation/H(+) antiporter [Amycolatopsis coloradensis]|uniref:Cation/H(+) antiporter n=1 Tax=Amycolatopsis coloradensis TaxID=76021 RepID=A0A1R0KWI1_9PSEU|nr:cation:proton antiporter [Amycolatopsis coloradensis]OLZ53394.1 cation/H(+) antiporter [Amycolatopsis coloradensis]